MESSPNPSPPPLKLAQYQSVPFVKRKNPVLGSPPSKEYLQKPEDTKFDYRQQPRASKLLTMKELQLQASPTMNGHDIFKHFPATSKFDGGLRLKEVQ